MTGYEGASCVGAGIDFFSDDPFEIGRAVKCCQGCPVRWTCLDDAMRYEQDTPDQHLFGVYGGCTPIRRASIRHSTDGRYRGRSA